MLVDGIEREHLSNVQEVTLTSTSTSTLTSTLTSNENENEERMIEVATADQSDMKRDDETTEKCLMDRREDVYWTRRKLVAIWESRQP